MDLLIAALVAVAVFIYLGRALPSRALYSSKQPEFDDPDAAPRSRLTATRLSKRAAIAISIGSIALFGALLKFAPSLDVIVALTIVAISLWVTVDSHQVRLRTYRTRLALHPIALFNAMMFLWPVIFPWYLIVCSKIGDGTLPKKSGQEDPIIRIEAGAEIRWHLMRCQNLRAACLSTDTYTLGCPPDSKSCFEAGGHLQGETRSSLGQRRGSRL